VPSKNHPFLVLVAGKAGNEHEKIETLGRRSRPKPHRVSRTIVCSPAHLPICTGRHARFLPEDTAEVWPARETNLQRNCGQIGLAGF
jgi:hypothetical protein